MTIYDFALIKKAIQIDAWLLCILSSAVAYGVHYYVTHKTILLQPLDK